MKINKRFLSLFLIALLTVVLVACGSTTQAPTTQAPTTTENVTTVATTTETTTTAVDLEALLDELAVQYADTLASETFVATDDISLVSSIGGYDITWSSNNTTYLENDGTVHRPSYTTGDQTVVLTASITDGTVTESFNFFVTISALAKTDQERANEVFSIVVTFPNKEKWTAADNDDLVFLTEGDDLDGVTYDVVWTSSNPSVMSVDGTITQPEDADVEVIMTASITINSVTYTDTYTFTVAKLEEGTPVSSIAEAAALGEDSYVNIQGVTVIAKYPSGSFFVTDGTDIIYVYGPSFSVEVGSVYDVSGVFVYYYNSPELKGGVTQPLKAEPSTVTAVATPITADTNIAGLVSGLTTPTPENPFAYEMYTITGKVWYDETLGNYSLFIVPSDYDFGAALDDATKPNGDALMIYYQSNMETLIPFEGKEVTIDVITLGWRTDKSVWYAGFFGTPMDIDVTIADDAEAVTTALNTLSYPETILEDTTLNFPADLYGVTLTYSSDDIDVISNTGVVDFSSQTNQVTVTITITAARGTVTDTKDVVIKVGIIPMSTLAEVLAGDNGTTFKTQGVVYYLSQEGYFIQDDSGKIFIYTGSAPTVSLGDEIIVIGERGEYNSALQLKNTTIESTVSEGNDYTQTATVYEPGITVLQPGYLYTVKALIAIEGTYNNVYFYDEDTQIGLLRYKSLSDSVDALKAKEGVVVVVDLLFYNQQSDGLNVFYFNGGPSDITEYVMTDQEKIDLDKASLNFGGSVYEATEIALPETGTNGSTIVWAITSDAGSNATLTAGTLSLNAVTEEATVEITATLTLGDLTETQVFTYTLKNLVMVDIGDFPTQTLGTVVTIHGNVYAVIQNGFFVEDTTGKLFVFSYDATYNVGDEVELTGEVAQYKGSFQMSNLSALPDAISTGNDVTQIPINYVPGTTVLEAGQTYRVVGTVAIEGTYNNVYIYINDTDSFEIYYKSPSDSIDVLEALVGKSIVVDMIYYNDDTVFVFTGTSDDAKEVVTDLSTLSAQTDGVWTISNDTMIFAQGVITGFGYNVIYIQDDNGNGFAMYKAEGYNDDTLNVGDKVIYYGELDDYPGTRQFSYGADLVAVLSTGNEVISTTMTLDELIGLTLQDGGKVITVTGLKIISFDDGGKMIFEANSSGEESLLLEMYRNDSINWLEDVYDVNDILGETTFTFVKFSGDNLRIELMQHEITDQQAVDAVADGVPVTLELSADFQIPQSELGTTITVTNVSSELTAYIDDTTTPGWLLVTQPDSDVTGTITVEISKGTATSVSVDIAVTVKAPAAGGTVYTEDFSFVGTGTSYSTSITNTDANGFDWDILGRPNDGSVILGNAADGSYIQVTATGGISSFTVTLVRAFTNTNVRSVELFVNDVSFGTFTIDPNSDTPQTFTVDNINVSGSVVIKLVSTSPGSRGAFIVDDFSWTTYIVS